MISFVVPLRVINVTNAREHWGSRARRVERHRAAIHMVWPRRGVAPKLPVQVTLTRIGVRRMDDDGVVAAMKPLRDQIAKEMGLDDGDPRICWLYAQERGGKNQYAVRVEVDELEGPRGG